MPAGPDCSRIVRFGLQLVWAVLYTIVLVYKLVEYGFVDTFVFLTNWSWALQTVFYWATLPALLSDAAVPWTGTFLAWTALPLYGLVMWILVNVLIILVHGSGFLERVLTKFEPGYVLFGNELEHFFPAFALTLYLFLNGSLIRYGLRTQFRGVETGTQVLVSLYQVWLAPIGVMGLYLLVLAIGGTSPHHVYRTSVSVWVGVVGMVVVPAVTSGIIWWDWVWRYRVFTSAPQLPRAVFAYDPSNARQRRNV